MNDFGLPNIVQFGESALVLEASAERTLALQLRLGEAARRLRAAAGTIDAVAGIGNLTLIYDPRRIDRCNARALLERTWSSANAAEPRNPLAAVEIPVRYGGADGPDLSDVAAAHGIDPQDVIERHLCGDYAVYVMGFSAGFAYLGGLDATLHTPRRAQPRARVASGSVGIGGAMTGVYPCASPGGWNIIGRTDAVLFDPNRTPAALLDLGTPVRFVRA